MNWEKEKLGNVLDFFNGKGISDRDSGSFKVYGANGVIGLSKEYRHENAIILGRVGAYCGAVMYEQNKFWATDNTIVVKPKLKDTERFFYYLLTYLKLNNYAGGAAQPLITQTNVKAIETGIPKKKEDQQKIASTLSAYDDLIENNTRRIKILEEMAQTIYKEWFVNFRFPGHEKVKFVDSPLGKIPEGWEVRQFSELVTTQYGYTESSSEREIGPKYLRGMDINKNSFINWDDVPYCKINDADIEKYKLMVGDIVIIRMADPGKVGIVEQEVNAIFASYLIRLKIKEKLKPYYLFYFLISDYYQGYIKGASTGTTRKSASAGVVIGIDLVVPNEELINLFGEKTGVLRKQINVLLSKNSNLRKIRDLLLPKLISGEVEV